MYDEEGFNMDIDEDDSFDWESAAAAIENISLLGDTRNIEYTGPFSLEKNPSNVKATKDQAPVSKPPLPASKLHQKSMLSFIKKSDHQQPTDSSIKKPGQQQSIDSFIKKPVKQQPIKCVPQTDSDLDQYQDGPQINAEAAKTWIYPVNVPMRDYQFSIVQTALFTNTLVSLPTGLGKTLVAAVVMYNFFRWYPTGKIVFTAPSRPLVLQQIEACHESVGIPQEWTIDLTGQVNPGQRSAIWQEKRVFFVTPQVFEKDIQSGSCPLKDIVCIVIDEAHRAMGNYSYCVVVKKLMEACVKFRILALTATPGSKQDTVQAVVDNLHISCLEYRSENDPDVRQYVHSRTVELIQVAMDSDSLKIKNLFLEIIQPLVNRLCNFGVFYCKDVARLVPYEFLTARDKFRQAPPPGLDPRQFGEVEACFGATITLYHMYKLLFSHGVRPAYEMLKQKMQSGPFARSMGTNEKIFQIKLLMQNQVGNGASSPKLTKLQELMAEHFETHDPAKTRVIIFSNFRESVKDILETLRSLDDKVKAMEFIGQSTGKSSKGQSQKVQQAVLQKFRAGGFNTIVATSIAEEGLDIMEVDFVICFDANISPLRMIQRMGRTGRKRDGRVVVLASEGAEAQGYLKKQAKNKALGKHMHNGGVNSFDFHPSPRMVPHSIKPETQMVELSIQKFVPRCKNKPKPVEPTLRTGSSELTEEESRLLRRYFEPHQSDCTRWKPSLIAFPHCQLVPTKVFGVKHSVRTVSMLIDTLQSLHDDKSRNQDNSQVPDLYVNIFESKSLTSQVLGSQGGGGHQECEAYMRHSPHESGNKYKERRLSTERSPNCRLPAMQVAGGYVEDDDVTFIEDDCLDIPLGNDSPGKFYNFDAPGYDYSSPHKQVDENMDTSGRNVNAFSTPTHSREKLQTETFIFNSGVVLDDHTAQDGYCSQHELLNEDVEMIAMNANAVGTLTHLGEQSQASSSVLKRGICSVDGVAPDGYCSPHELLDQNMVSTCIFSREIVSVDSSGYVKILSPPSLPLNGSLKLCASNCEANNDLAERKETAKENKCSTPGVRIEESNQTCNRSGVCIKEDNEEFLSPTRKENVSSRPGVFTEESNEEFTASTRKENVCNTPGVCIERSEELFLASTRKPKLSSQYAFSPGDKLRCFVACTPEERIRASNYNNNFDHLDIDDDFDSPRLCSLADQGVVPSSPVLENNTISEVCTSVPRSSSNLHDRIQTSPKYNVRKLTQEDSAVGINNRASRADFTTDNTGIIVDRDCKYNSPPRCSVNLQEKNETTLDYNERKLVREDCIMNEINRASMVDFTPGIADIVPDRDSNNNSVPRVKESVVDVINGASVVDFTEDIADIILDRDCKYNSVPRFSSDMQGRELVQEDSLVDVINRAAVIDFTPDVVDIVPDGNVHQKEQCLLRSPENEHVGHPTYPAAAFYHIVDTPPPEKVANSITKKPFLAENLIEIHSVEKVQLPIVQTPLIKQVGCTQPPMVLQTPVVQISGSSGSSIWRRPLEGSVSVQKPKKFRRLQKAKDRMKTTPVRYRVKKTPTKARIGRGQASRTINKEVDKALAADLIDEEAEVSSDGEASSDEDDTDEVGSLEDFIDDGNGTPSQVSGEPVDMMAVYRKSLLTPSPAAEDLVPWLRYLRRVRTPVSNDGNSVSSMRTVSRFSEMASSCCKVLEDDMSECETSTPSFQNHTTSHEGAPSTNKHEEYEYIDITQSSSKAHDRKRKLSFQKPQSFHKEGFWDAKDVTNVPKDFDDDLFSGIDLDALEIEAVQMSRTQMQGTQQRAAQPESHTHVFGANQQNKVKTENMDFFPSFNLDIDS